MLTQEKIARWLKESALAKALSNGRPPSRMFMLPLSPFGLMVLIPIALPTEISIRTAVHLKSPTSCDERLSCIRPFDETETSVALRIFDNAQQENQVMEAQQARSLFNDIQQLLETRENPSRKVNGYGWRPNLENYLVYIRNMMNLGTNLLVSGTSSCESSPIRFCNIIST